MRLATCRRLYRKQRSRAKATKKDTEKMEESRKRFHCKIEINCNRSSFSSMLDLFRALSLFLVWLVYLFYRLLNAIKFAYFFGAVEMFVCVRHAFSFVCTACACRRVSECSLVLCETLYAMATSALLVAFFATVIVRIMACSRSNYFMNGAQVLRAHTHTWQCAYDTVTADARRYRITYTQMQI